MFGDDDLSAVFYDPADGAVEFALVGSFPLRVFTAHMGEQDEEGLQGFVVDTARLIQYPAASVSLAAGDLLSSGPATWRVLRDPRLVSDGAECQAQLVPA